MAVTCARCGAQNPDGNQFCQACGTPLSAAAVGAPPAPPPPSAMPLAYLSPPPLPVAYASPYYNPAGAAPQAAVHRTPWVLIISAIVVLILVMAGCGTAIALLRTLLEPSTYSAWLRCFLRSSTILAWICGGTGS